MPCSRWLREGHPVYFKSSWAENVLGFKVRIGAAENAILAIPMSLAFAGMAFVAFSKNVRAKRVILPITLVVFHALWLDIFRRATGAPIPVLVLVACALIANAVAVFQKTHFCSRCGRTFGKDEGAICSDCEAAA